jgi:flagellin
MALSVVSNFSADIIQRSLSKASAGEASSIAKLAAGRRVLSAKNDAAALAIGARLGAEVSGLTQAQTNTGQARSMLQVADGGLATTNDILTRMKSLAVRAGSGGLSANDRTVLDRELQSLASEVDRIAGDTDFGGTKLLDGSAGAISFKVATGTNATDNIAVSFGDSSTVGLSISGLDITSQAGADAASAAISDAIDSVQSARAGIGVNQNRLAFAGQNLATAGVNTEAARSNLIDLDVASEIANLVAKQTLVDAGTALLAQANQNPKRLLKLPE